MSTTYYDARMALYDVVDGIDVTPVIATGWAERHRHPPKDVRNYPAFAVVPVRDEDDSLDSHFNDARLTFGVQLIDTWEDASDGEDRLSRLADLVRTRIRQEKRAASPLGGSAYTIGAIAGEWGADPGRGERWYQLNVEVKTAESLV